MNKYLKFIGGDKIPINNIFCIGKNYSKHIAEMGGDKPKDPLIFLKPNSAYIENGESIILPNISNLIHHEVELVVVIGQHCSNISRNEALQYIAGYAVGIDVTLRDLQKQAKDKGHPWAVAKGFHTSAPISDIVPAENFGNKIPFFDIMLKVNNEIRQKASTKEMERPVELLIEYLSDIFTLQPGDCIFTGTPEGVGPITKGDKLYAELTSFVSLEIDVQ